MSHAEIKNFILIEQIVNHIINILFVLFLHVIINFIRNVLLFYFYFYRKY